MKQETWKL